jgi:ABC-type transporter Mla maintaining outer membrane lipid asymmetry permease subunit MlaE
MVSGTRRAIAEVAAQVHAAAVAPLPSLVVAAAALGAALLALLAALLRPNGITAGLPATAAYAIVREVIPPFVAVTLIARSGPTITAAIGRSSRRTRAVAARVAGVMTASTGLSLLLAGVALAGAALAARALGLATVGVDLPRMLGSLTVASALVGLGKAGAFGFAIAAICGAHGLRARGSPAALARACGRGVVQAALACAVLDAAIVLCPLLMR